jgi:hypothetical protein
MSNGGAEARALKFSITDARLQAFLVLTLPPNRAGNTTAAVAAASTATVAYIPPRTLSNLNLAPMQLQSTLLNTPHHRRLVCIIAALES